MKYAIVEGRGGGAGPYARKPANELVTVFTSSGTYTPSAEMHYCTIVTIGEGGDGGLAGPFGKIESGE